MRIAIVHDYLVADSGAESVLRAMMGVFPEAPVFTVFYDRTKFQDFRNLDIKTTFMDILPYIKKYHRYFLPLYPAAIRSIDLKGYDIILSSSWAWSKNVKKPKNACHICYCHSPMRFVDGGEDFHLINKNIFIRWITKQLVIWMKRWDISMSVGVDYFIANSRYTADKIKKRYGRISEVIYPPTDTSFFKPDARKNSGDYFLIVSRLVPYKRIDIAIRAFNELGIPLKITGQGSEYQRLKKMASKNVEILGHISEKGSVLELYRGCRAFVMPQQEDWGIAALEAQACGKPVIAYGSGGALEYVMEGRTGHFFNEQTPEAIVKAVKEFGAMNFDPGIIRENASRYDIEAFKKSLSSFIEIKYLKFTENTGKKNI